MTVDASCLPDLLARHARDRRDRLALVVDGVRFTYGTLDDLTARLAAGFLARGVGLGDPVLVFLPVGQTLYLTLIALFRLGAVAVFVDPGLGHAQVEAALASVGARAFVGSAGAQLLRLRSAALRRVPLHVAPVAMPGTLGLRALLAGGDAPHRPPSIGPETGALLTFTSGTSGRPRGALRTHGLLLAQHAALTEELGTRPDDVDLNGLPIFLLHTLAAGATAIAPRLRRGRPEPADPGGVLRSALALGATTITGSPTFLRPLLAACRRGARGLPGVRAVFVGGANVPVALVGDLRECLPDGEVHVVYGSTEAEPISRLSGADVMADAAPGALTGCGVCVGAPGPSVRLRLDPVGEVTTGVGRREVGEILVAGAHVNPSYYRDPEADAAQKVRDADGTVWHRTGDCAWQDGGGRLWLLGRRGEAVAGPGGPLWPSAVEAAAEGLPGVARAALVGLEGRACLALERGPGGGATLVARVAERLAGLGLGVDEVRTVRAIPVDRRHRAKVDRVALRSLLTPR